MIPMPSSNDNGTEFVEGFPLTEHKDDATDYIMYGVMLLLLVFMVLFLIWAFAITLPWSLLVPAFFGIAYAVGYIAAKTGFMKKIGF